MAIHVPTDPAYALQWHLEAIGLTAAVWADFTGSGVRLGVFDGGVDYGHADIAPNYDATLHFVLQDGTVLDGRQTGREERLGHGTLVPGLVGGAANGLAGGSA